MSFELLTGATGFLGSRLLRGALLSGRDVAVLVRPTRGASAKRRVQDLLARFERETGERPGSPTVIEGDLHLAGLGLDETARTWIAEHCGRVVHSAASLAFHARDGEPYRSNVDGTRHLLEVCREAAIRDFHLVSTAYVCGDREGLVREDELESGQAFANDYERSKFLSETLIRHASFLDRWSVYRPSVIVGDSATGVAATQDGLYAFLAMLGLISGETAERVFSRLGMTPDARVNLVPVDWVSAVVRHLVDRPGAASCTYHLTHPDPTTAGELFDAAMRLAPQAPRVPDRGVDELLAVYRSYLKDHCEFDTSNTRRDAPELTCPRFEDVVLKRLVAESLKRTTLPAASTERGRGVALVVPGTDGGCFDVSSPSAASPVSPDEAEEAGVRAFCSAATLTALIRGEMSVEQAIYAGLLAMEGDASGLVHATHVLGSYLAQARATTSVSAAGVS